MTTKPWREIAVPHPDVLEGTFLQAEFAADINAVMQGRATHEYQDAAAFFQRTFITEGMRTLLTQVTQRLNGQGGELRARPDAARGTPTLRSAASRPGRLSISRVSSRRKA